jgi:hypothetical protein
MKRKSLLAGFVLAACLLAPSVSYSQNTSSSHTVTWWCVDLNDLYKMDVPLIAGGSMLVAPNPSPLPPCPSTSTYPITVPAGSGWAMGSGVFWIMNLTYPKEIRAALDTLGYKFVGNSPTQDLLTKVTQVRYDVYSRPGNVLVATYQFDPAKISVVKRLGQVNGALAATSYFDPDLGVDISPKEAEHLPIAGFLPVAGALPAGNYRACEIWTFSDAHNDGLSLILLGPGDVSLICNNFVVAP